MSFKDELNKNSRTPEQACNDILDKTKEQAQSYAEIQYENIKNKILDMAKKGYYLIKDDKKFIEYFHCLHNSKYVQVYRTPSRFKGFLDKKIQVFDDYRYILCEENAIEYAFFISCIKDLAMKDDIQITPCIYSPETKYVYGIPSPILGISYHKYDLYLKCSIKY